MKILHLSDTHGKHHELTHLPEADVVVHSGDFTFSGSEAEAYDFMNWLCDLPHKYKIFIAGNHDDCLYGATSIEGLPDNVYYLCNSGVIIEDVRFYGIPLFMADCLDGNLEDFFTAIPCDTDVLITHQPPFGICDLSDYGNGIAHHGDRNLLERISQLNLRCHLFGHEHNANGIQKSNNTLFSNAAVVNNEYELCRNFRLLDV